jgi:hypothetical protein
MGEPLESPGGSGATGRGGTSSSGLQQRGSGYAPSYGIIRSSNGDASCGHPMMQAATDPLVELLISFDAAPSVETRASQGHKVTRASAAGCTAIYLAAA